MSNRLALRLAYVIPAAACLAWLATPSSPVTAADHGDGPRIGNDRAADVNDIYCFLDPNDNTKLCLVATMHGFIVPGEAVNFGGFDPNLTYRFEIENTGDAKADALIDVNFSARTGGNTPQTATVKLPGKRNTFTAPTTPPTLDAAALPQVVTNNATNNVDFFAGEVDDPFFFDIPGFARFVKSVTQGAPDPTQFNRGRDSFAGYNTMAIAIRAPLAFFRGAATNNVVGAAFSTHRKTEVPSKLGTLKSTGKLVQVDRMGIPAVNVALIPFGKKDAYNAAGAVDGAKNKFTADIVATLTALGTNAANQGTLAAVAITKGDFLRCDLTIANSGTGGGTNAPAAFPNGRRLKDDTIDTILTIVANGTALGDNVNASDVAPADTFPFVALPQQPRPNGVTDDNTRN